MNVVKLSYGAITDVKDNRTKSLLRGLLNREIDEGTYSTYDSYVWKLPRKTSKTSAGFCSAVRYSPISTLSKIFLTLRT